MMSCPKCKKQNKGNADFCIYCGTALRKEARTARSDVVGKCCLCGKELRPREVQYANWLAADPFCTGCLGKFKQAKKELPSKSHGETLLILRRKRAEASEKAKQERIRAAEEAREQAEQQAREQAEKEARDKPEREARDKAEQEARQKAEEEARQKAEEEARQKAEQETRDKAEEEAREKAEEEARQKAEQEARQKAEEEAREKAEEEARQKAKQEARIKAQQEAYEEAEREAREKAEETANKIAILEQKVASEPNKWASHFGLAEFMDRCWSAHIDHLGENHNEWNWMRSERASDKTANGEYWEYRRRACECYLKAIALGINHPLYSANAKIRHAILLGESGWPYLTDPSTGYGHIGPIQRLQVEHNTGVYQRVVPDDYEYQITDRIRHYAREAEKDLRKHLREYPDNIAALRKLAQAVALHQVNDKVQTERLMAIDARIEEAEIRRQMSVAPSREIAPVGAPESPYPNNWNQLSEAVKHRDGHKCTDCGASGVELHVHHVVPLSKGGTNDLDNLATLCSMCHSMIHPRMGDTP
jgi:5-methylcytosine-specific restriction endonuclease McrA